MSLFQWRNSRKEKHEQDIGMLFDAVRERLPKLDEAEIKKITGFAGLLGKVAYADMEISSEELDRIRRVLTNVLKLETRHVASLIVLITDHRVQLFSVEDHFYGRMINEVCSREQKRLLLEALFSLAAADESISNQEDAAIWTIAKSLRLSHGDFIAVRKRFRDHLDVLKNPSQAN
jgi:uncharacterized tellurite resistance protein B-like protein